MGEVSVLCCYEMCYISWCYTQNDQHCSCKTAGSHGRVAWDAM